MGVEEFQYDEKGQLQQIGYRFKINACFAKEIDEYIDYLTFFWNSDRFGLPYGGGWAELPAQLFQILNVLKIESQFLKRK